jgi:hypothetical protein
MYAGLGHIPMEEAPERVMEDLRAFFGTSATRLPDDEDTRSTPA